ncbi:MAG: NAD-dependent protein deacylase [Kiritimatiellia bacterium]
MRNESKNITLVAGLLKKCKSILFITGAGISADAGLPTYRGIGGLYNGSLTEDGIPVETALAGATLATRPEITWKYLARIEKNCRYAVFSRGHEIIALMEKRLGRVWVLTQNIDGFHRAAGSRNVIDIHGDLHDLVCTKCGWRNAVENYGRLEIPPRCPKCSKAVRPDVVFFGEMLPVEKVALLERELSRGFDIYFSIGTTSVFPYISGPVVEAARSGKPTVEINPGDTEVSGLVDVRLRLGAAAALDAIWMEYLKAR